MMESSKTIAINENPRYQTNPMACNTHPKAGWEARFSHGTRTGDGGSRVDMMTGTAKAGCVGYHG